MRKEKVNTPRKFKEKNFSQNLLNEIFKGDIFSDILTNACCSNLVEKVVFENLMLKEILKI